MIFRAIVSLIFIFPLICGDLGHSPYDIPNNPSSNWEIATRGLVIEDRASCEDKCRVTQAFGDACCWRQAPGGKPGCMWRSLPEETNCDMWDWMSIWDPCCGNALLWQGSRTVWKDACEAEACKSELCCSLCVTEHLRCDYGTTKECVDEINTCTDACVGRAALQWFSLSCLVFANGMWLWFRLAGWSAFSVWIPGLLTQFRRCPMLTGMLVFVFLIVLLAFGVLDFPIAVLCFMCFLAVLLLDLYWCTGV